MREIGGYFGLEGFTNSEYHQDLIAVNNGRNALAYLLRVKHITKLHMPYFLCDSVAGVCQREGCMIEYYSITPDFLPVFSKDLQNGEWLYIVNFYGQITNKQIVDMKQR